VERAILNPKKVVELGAGEGCLVNAIKERFPNAQVTGVDLVNRPNSIKSEVQWHAANVFEYEEFDTDTVVVANLFVHHLQDEELHRLAERLSGVRAILFAEPYRGGVPLLMGRCIFPVINEVTRHDMIVSIKAGFRERELSEFFGEGYECSEGRGFFGGIRFKAI